MAKTCARLVGDALQVRGGTSVSVSNSCPLGIAMDGSRRPLCCREPRTENGNADRHRLPASTLWSVAFSASTSPSIIRQCNLLPLVLNERILLRAS